MSAALDGYFDVISPFAYLQWRRLRRDHADVALNPKPVLLAAILIAIWLAVYWSSVLIRGWRMHYEDTIPACLSIFACSILAGFAFAFWAGELLP